MLFCRHRPIFGRCRRVSTPASDRRSGRAYHTERVVVEVVAEWSRVEWSVREEDRGTPPPVSTSRTYRDGEDGCTTHASLPSPRTLPPPPLHPHRSLALP
eukprot:ctg_2071.g428